MHDRLDPALVPLAILGAVAALCALVALLAAAPAAAENSTPETALPLANYTYLHEWVNASDPSKQYWYKMDLERGDALFVYWYAESDNYSRYRILYSLYGPDSYASSAWFHGEYWYDQRANYNDYYDLWDWLCPLNGTYYFRFFAVAGAVGNYHAAISKETPKLTYRFARESGTVWWVSMDSLNKYDYYKVWLEAREDTLDGVEVKLTWTGDKKLDLEAYDLVDTFEAGLLNGSYSIGYDKTEVIRFTPSYTGWYYVRINYNTWADSEAYEIHTTEFTAPNDGDNTPENATLVKRAGTFSGRIEASLDEHDWYRFDLNKGDLLGVSMQIIDPNNPSSPGGTRNWNNHFEIQVYDPYMQRVENGFGYNGYVQWPVPSDRIENMPIQPSDVKYQGMYFLRVSFMSSSGPTWDTTNTSGHVVAFCRYSLQITIPNKPPRINATALEDVLMLEDTTWWLDYAGDNVSQVDLGAIFRDPEDGEMTFTTLGDPNVTARVTGGKLSLKPAADWSGEGNITVSAMDDSGNRVSATFHVTVVAVNDAPRVMPGPFQYPFLEDDPSAANRTFCLYDAFYDIDPGDGRNLTFTMAPDARASVTIDNATGDATLATAPDWNGVLELTFYATDPHDARAAAKLGIVVEPVNDAPRPKGTGTALWELDEGFMMATFDAADLLYDPDGDTDLLWYVHYLGAAGKANLSLTNEARDPTHSVLVVMPATGRIDWSGTVRITVECRDAGKLSGFAPMEVVVRNTPDAPVIVAFTPVSGPTFPEGTLFAFTVTDVSDPDPVPGTPTYAWSLRRQGQMASEVQNGTRNSYEMDTGYTSDGVYTLTVTVYDETGLACPTPAEWVVTVTKSNRAPSVTITSPVDNASVKEGSWVELAATGSDPDEEDQSGLVYEWYDGTYLIGQGRTKSIKNLSPGDHLITVIVKDAGGAQGESDITLKVKKQEKSPGAGAGGAALAVVLAAASLAALSGRARGRRPG